jgi:hypothetical protein
MAMELHPHQRPAKTLATLAIIATLFATATLGPIEASAVTKKPVTKKAVTKKPAKTTTPPKTTQTKTAQATDTQEAPSPAALIAELGPFTGRPDENLKVLVNKWGFPTWWPAPQGRIISVFEDRTLRPTFLRRQQSLYTYLDSPQTIEQLADRLKPPPEFLRQPAVTQPDGTQQIWFKLGEQYALTVTVKTTDKPIAEGKHQVRYTLFTEKPTTPDSDITSPAPPGQSLKEFLRTPPGSQPNELYVQLTVNRILVSPDGVEQEVSTPNEPDFTYDLLLQNTPPDYATQLAKNPPAGFTQGPYNPPTPEGFIIENPTARRLYMVNQRGPQTFRVSISHKFLPGEILPR